jgi:Uma2 family endonuclease
MKDELFTLKEPQAEYRKAVQKPLETEQEPEKKRVSLDEYLEMIARTGRRLEYHNGEIVDVQSATQAHGRIRTNLIGLIGNSVLDKDCDLYGGDREVWISSYNNMFYPDLLAVYGEHNLKKMSKNVEVTVNPTVIIEILSEFTEGYSWFKKQSCYKTLESVKQIIYVSEDDKYVVITNRTENNKVWTVIDYSKDEDVVPIGDCEILLKDIYRRVIFENKRQRV